MTGLDETPIYSEMVWSVYRDISRTLTAGDIRVTFDDLARFFGDRPLTVAVILDDTAALTASLTSDAVRSEARIWDELDWLAFVEVLADQSSRAAEAST